MPWLTYTPNSAKMECMQYIARSLENNVKKAISKGKSILLLGPRQTGKTTLIKQINNDLYISFIRPDIRQRYEKSPELILGEIEALDKKKKPPLIVLDEVQKVPRILDVVQDIVDNKKARFILTGSSARKLRRGQDVNLLPGRVLSLKLSPFMIDELPSLRSNDLHNLLMYGSLPGIVQIKNNSEKEQELESYVTAYLEEEIRAEAVVRNLGPFARFLELAASESGDIINLRKLSQEIGVSHTTIASYFQILEDCLIIEKIEPLTISKTRKKLTRSNKYLFFDLGVRRLAAKEGIKQPKEILGKLFEQFIGLELIRHSRLYAGRTNKICFWRDPDGPEVDWVLDKEGEYFPIEVKWTDSPSKSDIKYLKIFMSEYKNSKEGYLICQVERKIKLDENIFAIPWQEITKAFC